MRKKRLLASLFKREYVAEIEFLSCSFHGLVFFCSQGRKDGGKEKKKTETIELQEGRCTFWMKKFFASCCLSHSAPFISPPPSPTW